MKDSLGDRMKDYYESRSRLSLVRRMYTVIRVDGKAFHSYTRGLDRPFDMALVEDMNKTAQYLCQGIQGAKIAFVQSDEISLILTDFDELTTQAWFDNEVQKICSVSASMATARFNYMRSLRYLEDLVEGKLCGHFDEVKERPYFGLPLKWAEFDSRVFQVPTRSEAMNYLEWRQRDATRNSISAVAQSLYSHSELNNKNQSEQQEMIFQKGQNWNDYPAGLKRGRCIVKENYQEGETMRSQWVVVEPPIFSKNWPWLENIIPLND